MPSFHVNKAIDIDAPPKAIRDVLVDFSSWPAWSPWLCADPNCTPKIRDDKKGYSWESKIVGSGSMELTNATDNDFEYDLTFLTPWKSHSKVRFSLIKNGNQTTVSWSMDGSLPFFMFWMKGMMTAWVGSDYRRGLLRLKDYVEKGKIPSILTFKGTNPAPSWTYVGIRTTSTIDNIGNVLPQNLKKVMEWMKETNTQISGPPMSVTHSFDMKSQSTTFTVGLPVSSLPAKIPTGYESGSLVAGSSYVVSHKGAYRHLGNAWASGMMHGRAKKFASNKKAPCFEIYMNNPEQTPEEDLVTEVHFPARE